jgi:hypothetical protein
MTDEIKKRAIFLLLTVTGMVCAYGLLLNDEARKELTKTLKTIVGSYKAVSDSISSKKGVVIEGDLPNREKVLRQWEQLNY